LSCGAEPGRCDAQPAGAVVEVGLGAVVANGPVGDAPRARFGDGAQAQVPSLVGRGQYRPRQLHTQVQTVGVPFGVGLQAQRRVRVLTLALAAEGVTSPLPGGQGGREIEFGVGAVASQTHKTLKTGVLPQPIGRALQTALGQAQVLGLGDRKVQVQSLGRGPDHHRGRAGRWGLAGVGQKGQC
jgi:hypothetical protein